ncbi:MAG: hypothetical protein AAB447_03095 [Patescibacteria group bacterium]
MKRYFTHSGIVLGAIAFFGLSFGVAHAQNPVTAAVGSFFSFSLDTIALIATYPLEMLSAAMATILSIAGTLLDTTIKLSLDTSWYKGATGPIITLGWGIVRDFFNLTFIFILLYNGIRIILDLDNTPDAKRIATDVLIAALLINFSLFFTQLIIDGSNMLAVGLYNSIQTVVNSAGANSVSEAINVVFANQALYNMGINATGGFDRFINVVLRIVFSGITVYVFLSVSFLFIGRFVAFFLLMITSPIWIAGALIPRLKHYQDEFQKTLFDQAMLAPVFLFFLYIILQVITSDVFVALSQSGSEVPGGGTNKTGQILVFAILAALLLIAKSEATRLSGEIGKTINGYIGTAAGLAAGGVGLIGGGIARTVASSTFGKKVIGDAVTGTNQMVGGIGAKVNSVTSRIPLMGKKMQIDVAKNQASVSNVGKALQEGTYDPRRMTLPGAGKILEATIGAKNLGGLFKKAGIDMGDTKSPAEIERERRKEAEEKIKDSAKKKREEDNKALNIYVTDRSRTSIEIKNAIEGMDKDQFKSIDPKVFAENVHAARSLSKAQLQKLQENASVTQADRIAIKNHIVTPPPLPGVALTEAEQFMLTGAGRALWQ